LKRIKTNPDRNNNIKRISINRHTKKRERRNEVI
jgi:hypothetical protein